MKNSKALRITYMLIVLLVLAIIFKLGTTKGWYIFVFLMPLFLVIPLIISGHLRMIGQIAEGKNHPRVLPAGITQLVSMLAVYICLPGIGDTDTVYMFGFKEMNAHDPIVGVCGAITLAGLVTWLGATILFVRYLRRPSDSGKQQLGKRV